MFSLVDQTISKLYAMHNSEDQFSMDFPEEAKEHLYCIKTILHQIENIFKLTNSTPEGASTDAEPDEDSIHVAEIASVKDKLISNKPEAMLKVYLRHNNFLETKLNDLADPEKTTKEIFEELKNYKWDAKLVLPLAALAFQYGEVRLFSGLEVGDKNDVTQKIAENLAILRRQVRHEEIQKTLFDHISNLTKNILEITKCVITFVNDLPPSYFTPEVPDYTALSSDIPIVVYHSVKGILSCATAIKILSKNGQEITTPTTLGWTLSTEAHNLELRLNSVREKLDSCNKHVENKKDVEAYEMLCKLSRTRQNDNMKILTALINAKDDSQPLFDGFSKKKYSIQALRGKNVLLLISGLEFSHDELLFLQEIYNQSRVHESTLEERYELVWIPVLDLQSSKDQKLTQFKKLQGNMPWYSVYDPSLISKAAAWFIQREWNYKNKPIIVVLDPQGRIACLNAIHMMWIWGNVASPFTSAKEEALWKEVVWQLELIVDEIDAEIMKWIKEEKYIFLYGGDDLEWVRKFVKEAHNVAKDAHIPLEMVYVGKSNKREQVRRVLDAILMEKLNTHSWQEQSKIWFFWTRLESMLFSKFQLKQVDEHDLVMQEIKKLLSYDKQDGWIVLAKGSYIMVNGRATTGLQTLMEYENIWKKHVEKEGFAPAFQQHYEKLHAVATPCCRFEFLHAMGRVPDKLRCPECYRHMDMHMLTTFQCCHDENVDEAFMVNVVTPPTI